MILAKRLSEKEKKIIVQYFSEGKTIDELAENFLCTKETISRNLKRNLGNEKYKELVKSVRANKNKEEKNNFLENKKNITSTLEFKSYSNDSLENKSHQITTFTEIIPLDFEINDGIQKDLSSVPLSQVDLPNIVYVIVDKNIELEIKYLKEYPDWQFLSKEELDRKAIEIFLDLKIAKRLCKKDQKVIKVPNTDVFKIATPVLLNKGISRIVSADKLISL